jgi:hypothetical protein
MSKILLAVNLGFICDPIESIHRTMEHAGHRNAVFWMGGTLRKGRPNASEELRQWF